MSHVSFPFDGLSAPFLLLFLPFISFLYGLLTVHNSRVIGIIHMDNKGKKQSILNYITVLSIMLTSSIYSLIIVLISVMLVTEIHPLPDYAIVLCSIGFIISTELKRNIATPLFEREDHVNQSVLNSAIVKMSLAEIISIIPLAYAFFIMFV